MAVVRNLMVRAGADFSKAEKETKKFSANMTTFKNKLGNTMKLIAGVLGSLATMHGIKEATKSAMEYESSIYQIGLTMKQSAKDFQAWAKQNASAFGMSQNEAMKYGATYSNLVSSFASDTKQIQHYTTELLKAASVTSSATGRTIEDTMERIRSGMLGNTEAIEDLGIFVNISMIESTEAFKRFANGKSWNQLSFNVQQQIRLFAILEQATSRYGTTIADTTSSRQAMLNAQLKDAKLYLGQAFLPIYNAVLPALTAMATALSNVTQKVAAFMQVIFGKADVGQQAVDDYSSSVSDLGVAAEKAGKKASKAVASFDNLNLIGGTSGKSSSKTGSVGNASKDLTDSLKETNALTDQIVEDMRKRLSELISEEDKQALKKRVSELRESFKSLGDSIASLKGNEKFQKFVEGAKKWTIAQIIEKTGGAIQFLSGNIKALDGQAQILEGLFDKDFEKAWNGGEKTLSGFNDIMTSMMSWYFPELAKKWEETTAKISAKWSALKSDIKKYGDPTKLELRDFGEYAKDKLTEGFSTAVANSVRKLIELRDKAKEKWTEIKEKTGFSTLEPIVTGVFTSLVTKGAQKLGELRASVSTKWSEMKSDASTKWNEVKATISTKWDEIKNLNWNSVKGPISTTWDSIMTTAEQKWQGVVGVVKTNVNKIIDLINKMIRGVNKFSVDVPAWVGKIPGVPDDVKSIGFNIPEIPRLMVGTNYVQREGLAYLDEGEAVVPKKYNPAAGGGDNAEVIAALNRVERAVSGLKQVKAVISGNEVGKAATGFINSEYRRGNNPLPSL